MTPKTEISAPSVALFANPTSTTPSDSSSVLAIPELPPLNQTDFKDVQHWFDTDYQTSRSGGKRGDEKLHTITSDSPVLSSFMEDEHGNPIPRHERNTVCAVAREFFCQLLSKNVCPESWEKATYQVKTELTYLLESKFEWLRYCHGHWKARMVPTNTYSHWYKNAVGQVVATKVKASARKIGRIQVEPIEVDDSANDSDGDNIKEGRSSSSKRARTEDDDPRPTKQPRTTVPLGTCPKPRRTNGQGKYVRESF
jgi:hypothetical protein